MKSLASPATARLAGQVATVAFAAGMLLQLLLALGVLPSTMAWGGSQPVLTVPLRLASLFAVVVLGVFAYLIRRRAGLAGRPPIPRWVKLLAWVITAYMALNVLGNLASASAAERAVFGPLTLVLTAACLLVSLSRAEA